MKMQYSLNAFAFAHKHTPTSSNNFPSFFEIIIRFNLADCVQSLSFFLMNAVCSLNSGLIIFMCHFTLWMEAI